MQRSFSAIVTAEMTPCRVQGAGLLSHGRSLHKVPGEGFMRLNVGRMHGKSSEVAECARPTNDSSFGPPAYGQGQRMLQVVRPPEVGHVGAGPP